tara:strand:- start:4623 stop:5204 length:582 start_codon:yes stop_codon:yes gene_type:complete
MKIELIIFAITIFLIVNTYYDGKYFEILKSWKKYYKMIGIGFVGLSIYLFLKKNPNDTGEVLTYANNIIKYLPIDRQTTSLISPFLNIKKGNCMQNYNGRQGMQNNNSGMQSMQEKRLLNSGKNTTKRSVSETKKKYVAAQQGWKCTHCKQPLPAWFEVDHKLRLEYGGSNHIDNLEALCRDCHGKKTALENL